MDTRTAPILPRWASRADTRYHARRPVDATLADPVRADLARERVTLAGRTATLADHARRLAESDR